MTENDRPRRDEPPQGQPPAPAPPYGSPAQPPGYPYQPGPPPGYPPGGYPPSGYQQGPPPGYPPPPYPPAPQGAPGYGWGPPPGYQQPGPPPGGWQPWPQQEAAPRAAPAPVERIPQNERTLSAVAYLLPVVTSVGLLLVDKRRPVVRFHATQALAVDVVVAAASFLVTVLAVRVPELIFLYAPVLWGGFTLPRLFLLVQSARGVHVRIPWLADLADARARAVTGVTGQEPPGPVPPGHAGPGPGRPGQEPRGPGG